MDSSEVYHIKQQFTLGAYPALINTSIPDTSSQDYIPTILYKARALLASGDSAAVLALIPDDTENVALRAVAALAQGEEGLETLRDLCVEVEAEGDADLGEWERDIVAVLAATGFIRAGEVEEALETLRDSAKAGNESSAVLVHIYLSLSRPNTARKILSTALQANPDALVLQLSEAAVSLATGAQGTSGEPYASAVSFYTEQLANPSVSSAALLVGRGVVRILRGELVAARSDLEEAESILSRAQTDRGVDEVLAGMIVAAGLGAGKRGEAEELWRRLSSQYPSHPMVMDLNSKADLFDSCAAKFEVPPRVAVAAS
ncbi:coatomer epsilon subunit-domain-containing protein [Chiua virens]|nr:coatomer epsilon subunit-domain-containing protein [Chiua virens]